MKSKGQMEVSFLGPNSAQAFSNANPGNAESQLSKYGIKSVKIDEPGIRALVCVDIDALSIKELSKRENLEKPKFLIRFEPSVVRPQHSRRDIDALFTEVFEIGRSQSGRVLPWPQTWDDRDFGWAKRVPRIVAVSANKCSAVRGELYSLRRAAYSTLATVEVYGNGWSEPKVSSIVRWVKEALIAIRWQILPDIRTLFNVLDRPKVYKGRCEDKLQTMAHYKVALVIENSYDYMSEKLIDALLAGCIPVYVGPDVRQFDIPTNLVIQSDPDLKSVQAACRRALLADWSSHYSQLEKWKSSQEVRRYWTDASFSAIAKTLKSSLTK